MMFTLKSILIGLGIIAGIALIAVAWYALLFIGIPIGIFYLVHTFRKIKNTPLRDRRVK